MVDIKHKRCNYDNCNIRASYGILRYRPQYCKKHKLDDMYDVVSIKCQIEYCNTCPSFGYKHRTHCKKHKSDDMINLIRNKMI